MTNQEIADVAKALAHPIRVALIRELSMHDAVSPVQFARRYSMPLGNVSYHLAELRAASVVEEVRNRQRRGAIEHFYGLRGANSKAVTAVLEVLVTDDPGA